MILKESHRTRIKICGITTLEDGLMASELGADALGFVLAASKRRVTPETARAIIKQLPPFVITVGVFMNEKPQKLQEIRDYTKIDVVQLHGEESPGYCRKIGGRIIKGIRVSVEDTAEKIRSKMTAFDVSAILLDSGCGSGIPFELNVAVALAQRIILAGGLNAHNVKNAIQMVSPYAVDVSSGVELAPGKKNREKIQEFIQEVQ